MTGVPQCFILESFIYIFFKFCGHIDHYSNADSLETWKEVVEYLRLISTEPELRMAMSRIKASIHGTPTLTPLFLRHLYLTSLMRLDFG